MKAIRIDEHVVRNMVDQAESLPDALIELHRFILPVDLEEIDEVLNRPIVHSNTAKMILVTLSRKFEPVAVNMLWLTKGFSSDDSIQEGFVMVDEESITIVPEEDPLVEMFARKELEELPQPHSLNDIYDE